MELERVTQFVKGSQTERLKIATKLAFDARRRVKEGDLSVFLFPLIVAMVKDGLVDPPSNIPFAGIAIDLLLSFPIALYLFIFMWGRGKWKMRILFFLISFLDLVPFIDLIPFTTMCVVYARHLAKKDADEARDELAKLDATMKGLSRKEQIALQRARLEAQAEADAEQAQAGASMQEPAPEMNEGGLAMGNALPASSLRPLPAEITSLRAPMMDGVAASPSPSQPQRSSTQMRGQAANDDQYDTPPRQQVRVVSGSDVAPLYTEKRGVPRASRNFFGNVSASTPSMSFALSRTPTDSDFSLQRIAAQDGRKGLSDDDMRKKIRSMVREMIAEERQEKQTTTPIQSSPVVEQGSQTKKIPGYSEHIKPDLKSDPTLILFSRLNNPIIQEQIVDLLLKNEDYRVTETEKKWVDKTDENGKLIFDPDTDMPQSEVVEVPRFHNYIKKTRAELTQEVQERIRAVTQLGGEKNVVYLFPEIKDRSFSDAAYSPNLDEVFVNRNVSAEDQPTKNLTPKQLEVVLSHEKGHQIRRYRDEEFLNKIFRDTIDINGLSYSKDPHIKDLSAVMSDESLRDYMNASEIAERMSQLKNYFGFKGSEVFTREHLDYAKDHYVDDVFNNNMGPFLRAVTPEKESKFIQAMNTLGI